VTPEEDAYGQAMLAHYKGEQSFEIVELDDGYFSVSGGAPTYFSEYSNWHPLEQQAMTYVRGRVLDIGCGAGRHALYLQQQGHDVTGIDASPLAIHVSQLRGLHKALVMAIDDLHFPDASFDTIIMMGNNFGLMQSYQKARNFLRKFHRITADHATVIVHTIDVYQTENPDYLAYQAFNRERGRMSGQLRMRIRFKKFVTSWFDYLIVSPDEMADIVKGTGWEIQKLLHGDKSPYFAIITKVK
jgi:2-polyprenyl-3-methyl-5-hydroxy-6-metoxy-1,4-benzoquinol methylase